MECLIFSTIRRSAPVSQAHIIKAVAHTLRSEHKNGTISVHIIGDTKMKELNRIHRGKNKTTST